MCTFLFVLAISTVMSGCDPAQTEAVEMRACWVSTVGNLDFPSKPGLSREQLQMEIDEIVKNCSKFGLNAIFLQVRPNGDALYRSSVFPWSAYLSGEQGVAPDKQFDPLEYFLDQAHDRKIELHAWINPYRVGTGEDVLNSLSADNPARLHPEYTVTTSEGVYYNPGLPEVRRLVLEGISELVRHYEIDGIHFDDYFYPYEMDGFDDSTAFSTYGDGVPLADFRRNSVDRLVEGAYTLIKTLDDTVQFGISPFGIWANKAEHSEGSETNGLSAYFDIYSDSKKWVEQGWVDYICPQVYWSNENDLAPYETIVDWWDRVCFKHQVRLCVGLAVYKVGTKEVGWENGAVIREQLVYAASKDSYAGHSFFRYGILLKNPLGALDAVLEYYASK